MQKTVWFIRHAQSQANARKDYRADNFSVPLAPLSELGLKQAESVVNYFDKAPDVIVTSSHVRIKQTASHVIKKYPDVPQEEWDIHEFTYLSLDKCFTRLLVSASHLWTNTGKETIPCIEMARELKVLRILS